MLNIILPFLGIIIGALLQYYFTRHIENLRHRRDLRSKAYMDYLKCVCEQAQFIFQDNTKEKKEIFVRTADSKARICLYGSAKAIHAFSVFEQLGASMGNREQRNAFIDMIRYMRSDSGSELIENTDNLKNVTLGCRHDD